MVWSWRKTFTGPAILLRHSWLSQGYQVRRIDRQNHGHMQAWSCTLCTLCTLYTWLLDIVGQRWLMTMRIFLREMKPFIEKTLTSLWWIILIWGDVMEICEILLENFTGKTVSCWKTVKYWEFLYIEKKEYGKYGQNSYIKKMQKYKKLWKLKKQENRYFSCGDGKRRKWRKNGDMINMENMDIWQNATWSGKWENGDIWATGWKWANSGNREISAFWKNWKISKFGHFRENGEFWPILAYFGIFWTKWWFLANLVILGMWRKSHELWTHVWS